jgi:hypothetical protein
MPFELPAELPAVPTVDPVEEPERWRLVPANDPPVPSVLLVPERIAVPAAPPPVPKVELALPLPAVLPLTPRVLDVPVLPSPKPASRTRSALPALSNSAISLDTAPPCRVIVSRPHCPPPGWNDE